MSSYPPPPPPFDSRGWARAAKEQRRTARQQARLQRNHLRMQYRSMRRRSIVGPLVILGLGIIFLLVQMGRISWNASLTWLGNWWPVVLIGAGLVLLAEWAIDQRTSATAGPRLGRTVGGGVVFLLVLLAIIGSTSHFTERGIAWKNRTFGTGSEVWDFFGDQHDWDDSVSSAIPAGDALFIHNPRGDVSVTGSSQDGQVHVSVHKRASSMNDNEAARKEQQLQPVFSSNGGNLNLNVAAVNSGQADLTIQVPRDTPLTISADSGDISVQEIHGPVTISANHGQVDLSAITGAVTAHVNNSNASFSAHSITGGVALDGHAGDLTLSDITGPVSLQGEFYGTTDLERVNGTVNFRTYRTQFSAARLDGELDVTTGSELRASQVLGPIVLTTSDRDVTLDRVQGSVAITNTNGPVAVLDTAPLGSIDIKNRNGSVDVGVPTDASFTLNVQSKDGSIDNDFGLQPQGSDDDHTLQGAVGSGGPLVTITAREGDVHVHKSTVAPLSAAPPVPPRITSEPSPTAPPASPQPLRSPRLKHSPEAPKTPAAPKAPAANF